MEINPKDTLKGYFWLPETPKKEVRGEISFKEKVIELTLFGIIGDSKKFNMIMGNEKYDCIVGQLDSGRSLTLFSCSNWGVLFSARFQETLHVAYILYADLDLSDNRNKVHFHIARFQFPHINEFIGMKRVPSIYDTRIVNSKPKKDTLVLKSKEMKIVFNYDWDAYRKSEELIVRSSSCVTIVLSKTTDFTEIIEQYIRPFMELYSFLTGHYLYPMNVAFYKIKNLKDFTTRTESQIAEFTKPITKVKSIYEIPVHEMIPIMGSVFMKFLEVRENYSELISNNRLFYLRDSTLETKFITAVNILEQYSRCVLSKHHFLMKRKEYRKLLKKLKPIIENINLEIHNPKLKKRIYEQISFSYERSLRESIIEMFESHIDVISELIDGDASEIVDKICYYRNSLTHQENKKVVRDDNVLDLHKSYIHARVIFEANLFSLLSIPHDISIELIRAIHHPHVKEKHVPLSRPTLPEKC
jgi:hypothetical protein